MPCEFAMGGGSRVRRPSTGCPSKRSRGLLFLIGDEIFARCQSLERQPQAQIVKHQALQFASQHLSRVAYRERWLLQDLPGNLPGTRQELNVWHHLADQPTR